MLNYFMELGRCNHHQIKMKYSAIIFLIVALFLSLFSGATEQRPDRLVVNGDTMLLHALPLAQLKKHGNWEKSLFPDTSNSISTACWRGYIAYWELVDNLLYLTNIYNCDQSAKVLLDSLFPGEVRDGRVRAEWFTDTVTAYRGKLVYYNNWGFSNIYEDEFEYVFERGLLKTSAYFDNSPSTYRTWSKNRPGLEATIDSLVDWATLPAIETHIKVMVKVKVDKWGNVDSVLHVRGDFDAFNQEAKRVARLLTGLPVIYKRGEMLRDFLFLPFNFTERKQQQFR